MQISEQSIIKLRDVIATQPYRTRNDLARFFKLLGLEDNGISSRIPFTENQLLELNEMNQIENALLKAIDPRNFLGTEIDINDVVSELNQYLHYDRYYIRLDENFSPEISLLENNGKAVKNIIFASNGPKPEIILADALNNDIEVVRNGEFCLIYNQAVPNHGLTWKDLVTWWAKTADLDAHSINTERALYKRLIQSLPANSPPSKLLFETYYAMRNKLLGDQLPALIPEVYLHYDPKTLKDLEGNKRISRQRMDFLILLSKSKRIVIEVDGKHHYADGDMASPIKYTEMVSEDRRLSLAGYEVYRFSGYELTQHSAKQEMENFFTKLFKKHGVLNEDQ